MAPRSRWQVFIDPVSQITFEVRNLKDEVLWIERSLGPGNRSVSFRR
jgi:hypothetical protein